MELRLHFSRTVTFDLQTQRNSCFCAVELQSVLQLRAAVSSAEPTLCAFVSLMAMRFLLTAEQQNHLDSDKPSSTGGELDSPEHTCVRRTETSELRPCEA